MAERKTVTKIKFFGGAHFMSNFYASPLVVDGKRYATNEHYFQAAKFFVNSPAYAERIRLAKTPFEAKDLGGKKKSTIFGAKMRSDWDSVRDSIMNKGLMAKFGQNRTLLNKLLATGDAELIENSPYDDYWGIGCKGDGQNKLGLLLEIVRKYYVTIDTKSKLAEVEAKMKLVGAVPISTAAPTSSSSTDAPVPKTAVQL